MRYLVDRGCDKVVTASSIAAVGFQSVAFRPDRLPIPDEHACYDRDGYGFSKFMMEEVTRYLWRQNPDVDFIDLRLSSVIADASAHEPTGVRPIRQWSLGSITVMLLSDAVRLFSLAALAKHKPGVRIMNAAAEQVWATAPTADILANWWGDGADLAYYRKPGNEHRGVFAVERIASELGFTADATLNRLK